MTFDFRRLMQPATAEHDWKLVKDETFVDKKGEIP
jgi:hypothetical protein